MIAHMLFYCSVMALVLAVAATALEQVLRLYRRPARGVWGMALAGSVLVPAALWLRPAPVGPVSVISVESLPSIGVISAAPAVAPAAPLWPTMLARLDATLLPVWFLFSLVLGVALAVLALRAARQRRAWDHAEVAGERVRVADATGPAVAGFFRPEIVLPSWMMEWSAARQRLIVEHEREHIRARDPLLLLAALVALVLMPWNAALWWQVRRLRLAIEIDCDARVLAGREQVREYGALLLEVGRFASSGRLPVAAFSEPASLLESRIRWMVARPPRHRPLVAAVLIFAAAAAPVAASALPAPTLPAWRTNRAAPAENSTLAAHAFLAAEDTVKPQIINRAELVAALRANYPAKGHAAGNGGTVVIRGMVNEQGQLSSIRVVSSPSPAYAEAARRVFRVAKFSPAIYQNRAVRYMVSLPIIFAPPAAPDGLPAIGGAEADAAPAPLRDASGAMEVAETGSQPKLTNSRAVFRALNAAYPHMYADAGVGGTATMRFVINQQGEVDTSTVQLVQATNDAFAEAAMAVVAKLNFTPIFYKGEPVRVWVTLPITFHPPSKAAANNTQISGLTAVTVRQDTDFALQAVALETAAARMREQSAEMAIRAAKMRARSAEMTEKSAAMRQQTEEMHRVGDRMRQVVRGIHSESARTGTGDARYIYLLLDADGRVVKSGTHPLAAARDGSWSSTSVEREMRQLYPNARFGNAKIVRTTAKNGVTLNMAFVSIEPGSPAP